MKTAAEQVTALDAEVTVCGLTLKRGYESQAASGISMVWRRGNSSYIEVRYWGTELTGGCWRYRFNGRVEQNSWPTFEAMREVLEVEVRDHVHTQNQLREWAGTAADKELLDSLVEERSKMLAEAATRAAGTHLWDIKCEGYWSERAYHAKPADTPLVIHPTWDEFLRNWGTKPLNYDNPQVLGFGWVVDNHYDDPYYRSGRLDVYCLIRRTGHYMSAHAYVCPADEPAVRAFLQKHLNKLLELWQPLGAVSELTRNEE
jgi:hypothetical protein